MNQFRFARHLLWSCLKGKKVLVQINIHITDRCDLRCRYCYIDFRAPQPDMPLQKLKEILSEARRAGTERISYEGGEPLLHPEIEEIALYALAGPGV